MGNGLQLCERGIELLDAHEPSTLSAAQIRDELLGLQRLIDRLTTRQARVLLEADRTRFWQGTGAKDMPDWLARATKTSYADAAGKAKLGHAMNLSPTLAGAVAAGDVSVATATAVATTILTAQAGTDELVEQVKSATPVEAKKAAEAWKDTNRTMSSTEFDEVCHQKRRFSYARPVDGMISGSWSLPVLDARTVINTLSHLGGKPSDTDRRTGEQRLADGLTLLADAYAKGAVTGGHERPTILVSITAEAFAGLSDDPGLTGNGDPVPADTVRQMADNAYLQRVLHTGTRIIELTTKQRLATTAQYETLFVRDGGCRWPGCDIPARWCDADHLIPWEHHGPTELSNLVLWCRHHHREKHRPGVHITGDAHNLQLTLTNGTILDCPPKGIITKPPGTSRGGNVSASHNHTPTLFPEHATN